ncbi:MAG: cellulase family glycosylhydrolase [Bacteroides sp.]|nr:cellulase family glycosylhydrolase [Bacteroides sp.]
MKKILIKALSVFAALTLAFTGCSAEKAEVGAGAESPSVQENLSETSEKTEDSAAPAEENKKSEAEASPKDTAEEKTETLSASIEETEKNEPASDAAETEYAAETTRSAAETDDAAPTEQTTVSALQITLPPVPETAVSTQPPAVGSLTASCNVPNTWEENGSYCGTCEFTVANGGGNGADGWTVRIVVPIGFKITSSWNGKFNLTGTVLTVINESYNGSIPSGSNTTFGFNFSSPSEFKPPYSVTVNGTEVTTAGGVSESAAASETPEEQTAAPLPAPAMIGLVKEHGKLSVKDTQLVDKNGDPFQLKGMSTHGLSWFPEFVNENVFKTLRDDWNTNAVRLAMYTAENGGYCSGGSQADLKALVDKGVQTASELGMYVIIDWHILSDGNPQTNKSEALKFFDEISLKYGSYENVIYEICNEPNGGVSWSGDIKPYAEEVIAVIRKNAPDSVIIVGTPTWSQDIDMAAADPLKEKNVLYALHFYAATHTDWLRQRLVACHNKGLPVIVSEFGTCDASGNGAYDFDQSKQWLDLLDKYGISYFNWSLANKNESASALRESTSANGGWSESDLSEGGAWIRKWFRGEA